MSSIIGINLNLSKIDKNAIKEVNGVKYINLTLSVNDEADKYGKDVSIWNEQTKEQREKKEVRVFCGNGKVLYKGEPKQQPINNITPF